MGKVVAAVGMSHAPGALAFPETCPEAIRAKLEDASLELGKSLAAGKPDVIFAFLDDHFENFYRNHMPSIAIGVADSHVGPADQWMETLRIKGKTIFPGAPDIAEHVLLSLVEDGFDVSRAGSTEYGNNLLMPWILMNQGITCPIIPIYINVFTPPLISYKRAYTLGEAVANAVDSLPADTKVALLCTGGLSHWPPYWNEFQASPDDKFMQRMKRFQTEGKEYLKTDPNLFVEFDDYEIEMAKKNEYPLNNHHPLVNDVWDRKFMDKFCGGDSTYMKALTYQEVEKKAGHGGHEVLNWVALLGAMRGAKSKLVVYEPVRSTFHKRYMLSNMC
jgi:2,3-dihydroxyphenylpropionate 1,2-dioxygenase